MVAGQSSQIVAHERVPPTIADRTVLWPSAEYGLAGRRLNLGTRREHSSWLSVAPVWRQDRAGCPRAGVRSGFPFCDLAARVPRALSAGSELSGGSTRLCAAKLARDGTIHSCPRRVLSLGLPEIRVRP
jgi:hypothetical protein